MRILLVVAATTTFAISCALALSVAHNMQKKSRATLPVVTPLYGYDTPDTTSKPVARFDAPVTADAPRAVSQAALGPAETTDMKEVSPPAITTQAPIMRPAPKQRQQVVTRDVRPIDIDRYNPASRQQMTLLPAEDPENSGSVDFRDPGRNWSVGVYR